MGGREAEEGGGKPREGGQNHWGEAERSRKRNWERRDGEVGECRYWARIPRERTMVESEAGAGRPEPGSRGRSMNKMAKGGEVAGSRITGETEWAEDEAGERERDQRRGGGVAVIITVASLSSSRSSR